MVLTTEGIKVHAPERVVQAFLTSGNNVITFGGFGELGYEDEKSVLALCAKELDRFNPRTTIVNTGTLITSGFRMGIPMIYALAKKRGFRTTGIHPSVALNHPERHHIAAGVDHVFFVRDTTWGGCHQDGDLSNTLRVLLEISSEFIVLGGGYYTAQELQAFLKAGKRVRFHKAAMHQKTTDRWCGTSGVRMSDYWGTAYRVWKSKTHQ